MAIRSFPADVKLQHFFTENYNKESNARLQFYFENKKEDCNEGRSGARFGSGTKLRGQAAYAHHGLPKINPMEFAMKKKREEDENLRRIIDDARKKYTSEEMRTVDPYVKDKLYDGFTKEGKGRYQYLQSRNVVIPEKKYTFPMLSSWHYGWKLEDEDVPKRPDNARTKLIRDTFFTRNGVPSLPDPTARPFFERAYTTN